MIDNLRDYVLSCDQVRAACGWDVEMLVTSRENGLCLVRG